MSGHTVTTHEASVAAPRAGDADLPGALKDSFVYVPEEPQARMRGGGLPRSLRDVLGRVEVAEWSGDDTLTVVVTWSLATAAWAPDLLGQEQAELRVGGDAEPGGRAHLVLVAVYSPVRPGGA